MGGCFVQTAAGGLCSSRVSRLCALSLGGGVGSEGQRPKGRRCHSVLLARSRGSSREASAQRTYLPDPLCARPAPARPTHAMSSASAMHVHVHIPQGITSPAQVHLWPPDSKWMTPPISAASTFIMLDEGSDRTEGSAKQIAIPRAREEQGPVRGNKKLYQRKGTPGPVRGKGTDKKKVARPVGGKGTAAGKKKAGP